MAAITLHGNPVSTSGSLPAVGTLAPSFTLTNSDLGESTLADYAGKKVVLNIFPSVDTSVCATSVRKFNASASSLANTVVLCISADLPFAQSRFCGAEGLNSVITLSTFRHPEFGIAYGATMTTGPLAGLMSRAVVVINEKGLVVYTEQVPEIAQEPNYDNALRALE